MTTPYMIDPEPLLRALWGELELYTKTGARVMLNPTDLEILKRIKIEAFVLEPPRTIDGSWTLFGIPLVADPHLDRGSYQIVTPGTFNLIEAIG